MRDYFIEPKRPKSHQIGDQAKDQVTTLFSSQGWVINPIINDYGEDLLVQLTEGSNLIPVRFYVQIKGTDNIQKLEKKGSYKIAKIKSTSISHWLNSIERTFIILWDVKRKSGVWGFASGVFSQFNPKKQIKFYNGSISKTSVLNKKSINSFKMNVIAHHCDDRYTTMAATESLVRKNKKQAEFYGIKKNVVENEITNIVTFFLTTLGILKIDNKNRISVDKKFHKMFFSKIEPDLKKINFEIKSATTKLENAFQTAAITALLRWTSEKFDIGLHGGIIEGCSRGLMAYYRDTLDGAKNILKEPK